MKKHLSILISFIIAVIWLSGCQKTPMEIPEYPLNKEIVESALSNVDLPVTIVEENQDSDYRTSISLRDSDRRLVAGIASEAAADWRFLGFTLIGYQSQGKVSVFLTEDQWDDILSLGILLYGGFTSQNQVYDDFIKNYERESIITEYSIASSHPYIKEYEWVKQYGDTYCSIIVKEIADGTKEISNFKFYNSKDISNTNSEQRAKVVLNTLFSSYGIQTSKGEFDQSEQLAAYLKNYSHYYSEEYLDRIKENGLITLMKVYAHELKANIQVTDIKLNTDKDFFRKDATEYAYEYSAILEVTKDTETKNVTVTGTIDVALLLNGWKVTDITVINRQDFE